MTIRIREAWPQDHRAMAALHRRAILAVPDAVYALADRVSWAAGIDPVVYARAAADGERFLLAEVMSRRVAGFCSFVPDKGVIVGLYVDPPAQGAGAGSALAEAAEAAMRDAGASRITVESSLAGVGFYERRGYRVVEATRHATRGGLMLEIRRMTKDVAR